MEAYHNKWESQVLFAMLEAPKSVTQYYYTTLPLLLSLPIQSSHTIIIIIIIFLNKSPYKAKSSW